MHSTTAAGPPGQIPVWRRKFIGSLPYRRHICPPTLQKPRVPVQAVPVQAFAHYQL